MLGRAIPVLAASIFVLACSSNDDHPQSPPTYIRLHASPPLEERALTALTDLATPQGFTVELGPAEEADLIVSNRLSTDGASFVTRYWVPVAAPRSPFVSFSMEDLGAAFASSGLGRARPVEALLPSDQPAPLDQWWPGATTAAQRIPLNEIVTRLEEGASAIALVPLGAVDARVRALGVDGINVVFGEGDPSSYPLAERAAVESRPDEDSQFAHTLGVIAKDLASTLSVILPEPTILRATGDVLPVRCTLARIEELGGDFRRPFAEVGPWLAEADIAVSSLDAAVSDAGTPFGCQETFSLLAPASAADGFEFAGIDVMTVATNHVKDCGTSSCGNQSFRETLTNLRERNVQPVGGGENLAEARRPAILTARGVQFAFLGYDQIASYYHAGLDTPGTAPLNEASLREDIAGAREQADVIVVLPQWGIEYTADPNSSQRALAQTAVQAGADLVIGNHPHWVQAAEVVDGSFVAYALGNFIFDQDWSLETQQGTVLEAAFHGPRLAGVRYLPVRIHDNHQPRFAGAEEARQILERIWDASDSLD